MPRRLAVGERVRYGFDLPDRVEELMDALFNQMLHGLDPLRFLEYEEMFGSLTLEEVREAAEKYFDLENYVRVVLLPEEGEG